MATKTITKTITYVNNFTDFEEIERKKSKERTPQERILYMFHLMSLKFPEIFDLNDLSKGPRIPRKITFIDPYANK